MPNKFFLTEITPIPEYLREAMEEEVQRELVNAKITPIPEYLREVELANAK